MSPVPRRAPVATVWRPSKSWKAAPAARRSDGAVDDGFVVGVDVGDDARKDEKDGAHAEHEAGAEEDGGVASIARGGGIAAADGLAYANGSGGRDPRGTM